MAFITGAARVQGRNHAIRLAEEGLDIIAIDLLEPIATVHYPLFTPEDLQQTVKAVEALDPRIIASKADVRHREQLVSALGEGIAALGSLDVVWPMPASVPAARHRCSSASSTH